MARLFDDATSEELRILSPALIAVPLTMSAWFNRDADVDGFLVAIGVDGTNNNRFSLQTRSGGAVRITTRTTSNAIADTIATSGLNAWHHAAATSDAVDSRAVYLDGGNVVTNSSSRNPSGINMMSVGAPPAASSEFFSGAIAEVGIWNVALTDMEVLALASGVLPKDVRPESLVAYWPLYAFTGDAPDFGGGKFNLTDTNTVLTANHAPIVPYSRRFWGHGPLIGVAAAGARPQGPLGHPLHGPLAGPIAA